MKKSLHILVTGGCGYKGTVLIPKLLARGYRVTLVDTLWFGNFLKPHKNLNVMKVDVRKIEAIPMQDVDIVIHLASSICQICKRSTLAGVFFKKWYR